MSPNLTWGVPWSGSQHATSVSNPYDSLISDYRVINNSILASKSAAFGYYFWRVRSVVLLGKKFYQWGDMKRVCGAHFCFL